MFTRQELEQLVHLSGAALVDEHNLDALDIDLTVVVLCDDENKSIVRKYHELKNTTFYVIPEFFLDSLVLYEVQPIRSYEIVPRIT